jgi:hypothetical protein
VFGLGHEPLAVLSQRVAHVGKLRLLAFVLAVKSGSYQQLVEID